MTNRTAAIKVVRRLRRAGFVALLAGGCVRDMLLGRRASDYDVATDARPRDVVRLFERTVKVGAKFGVVIVLIGPAKVEVATFRMEANYADGRHPGAVRFADAAADASRRDFTINGMFFDPESKQVIDYVGGQADLKRGLIRTIGRADDRFDEDHLRMLRAVRFATQLDFALEERTFAAIRRSAAAIRKISGERVAMELEGILASPDRAKGAAMLIDTGLAEQIFDGLAGKGAKFAVDVLRHLPRKIDFALGLSGFFAGYETELGLAWLRVLRPSRKLHKHVRFLLSSRGRLLNEKMSLAELKQLLSEPYFEDLYALEKAIQKARPEGRRSISALIALRRRINALGDVELRPAPLLDGYGLMRLGAVPGPGLGQLAREMYVAQLEGELQTVSQAEEWASKWLEKHRSVR